jgi:hypothetical protein
MVSTQPATDKRNRPSANGDGATHVPPEATATRPTPAPVDMDMIPAVLKAIARWCVWRYVQDADPETGDVDWDKPPVNAKTGGLASSTNAKTWSTFEDARAAYSRGGLDGVGFVLHVGPGDHDGPVIVAIDLDKCRDPETGVIEDWALQIIRAINSYTEVSPSGRGIRIFLFGWLPPNGRKKGRYENYQTGRYVTVTGQHLEGTPLTVEHRQAELEGVHRSIWRDAGPSGSGQAPSGGSPTNLGADEVVRRAREAKNGNKFERLWTGNLTGHKSRSEADLALCNYLAFWCGPDEGRIDELFRQSGLFRSKWNREDYRKRTIAKALAGRTEFFSGGNGGSHHQSRGNPAAGNGSGRAAETLGCPEGEAGVFRNFTIEERQDGEKKQLVKVGRPIAAVARELFALTDNWPKRVGSELFVEGDEHQPLYLDSTDATFAWIAGRLPDGGHNSLRWAAGEDKVTQAQFFHYLQQAAEHYDAVEGFPHHPPRPRTYYMHPPIAGGDGKSLQALLDRFKPLTLVDRDLILTLILTLAWGGAPGQRPAFLVTTDDEADAHKGRGAGKTAVPRHVAHLFGGLVEASGKDDMAKLKTRLLSPGARRQRVVLIDNIKSLKFSWAELEALITSDVISGHEMFVGEGQRPNTLTNCLTVNGASLSRDMAQRTVVIKVQRPKYSATWDNDTRAFINANRWAIIGDCVNILRRPAARLASYSRWGAWEAGVLSHVGDPAECQRVIAERQEGIDDDANESATVREGFRAELARRQHDADTEAVWIPASVAAWILNESTGERFAKNRAGVYLKTLAIPELRKSDQQAKGWAWRGLQSDLATPLMDLKPLPGRCNAQECDGR